MTATVDSQAVQTRQSNAGVQGHYFASYLRTINVNGIYSRQAAYNDNLSVHKKSNLQTLEDRRGTIVINFPLRDAAFVRFGLL